LASFLKDHEKGVNGRKRGRKEKEKEKERG
jgi:hypothetical protein